MAKKIAASYVYPPDYQVSVQEYDDEKGARFLLVRVSSRAVVLNMGFDLSPEHALELADALTQHAKALQAKSAEEVEA